MSHSLYLRPRTWTELAAWSFEGAAYIAGGTEMIPLMRAGLAKPAALIDLARLVGSSVEVRPGSLAIGARTRLSDLAAHQAVRAGAPAITQALLAGASPQIRNMATVGGNLLQRTRCGYFRDRSFPCNKRAPGSGCPALDGETCQPALFGASARCVAVHASDLAVTLSALDATVDLRTPSGQTRSVHLNDFFLLPGDRPDLETVLGPGEMIMRVEVPLTGLARRSAFVKVRERASFEFALVSAAVALDLDSDRIHGAHIALGGVAPKPWRLLDTEARLRGRPPTDATFGDALAGFGHDAHPLRHNAFKLSLARTLVLRCLSDLARTT